MEFLRCRAGVVEFAVKLSSSLLVYSSVISVSHPRYWSPPSQIGFDNNSLSVSILVIYPLDTRSSLLYHHSPLLVLGSKREFLRSMGSCGSLGSVSSRFALGSLVHSDIEGCKALIS